jgi:DNA polymerase type B, organellar and viral
MINSALIHLLNPSYNKHKIYVHNFSNFFAIFLVKYLLKLKYNNDLVIINPTIKDGKFINLDIIFGKYKISFRDSYLILLFSLKKLAETFGVGKKGEFKYNLVDNLNNKELLLFREDLISYCKNDCYILYKIIQKFNNLIFDKWFLNINNFPTLPSVAMGLFRSKFLMDETICKISGETYKDIKQSYTGGSTDLFIPHGVNIHGYDINSLYPHSMANNLMPINNIKYFEGNVTENNLFGFFFVEVTCPDNLNIPILQLHYKNRTVSPLGKFTAWFFSEELYNARDKFNYKFKIIKGYTFDKANIFKNYVEELYSLRLTFDKLNPMNYIAKILMNSLYRRFGLNPLLPDSQIIDKDLFEFPF